MFEGKSPKSDQFELKHVQATKPETRSSSWNIFSRKNRENSYADLETKETDRTYQTIRALGQGGSATVYQAYDPTLNRSVALKMRPLSERSRQSPLEVEAWNFPEDRGVLPVYDYFRTNHEDQDYEVIVEKLVNHKTQFFLNTLITNHRRRQENSYNPEDKKVLSLKDISSIITDLSATVGRLAKKGIFNRDIKPQNIIYDVENDYTLLSDFGLVREDLYRGMTLAYSAPEIFEANKKSTSFTSAGNIKIKWHKPNEGVTHDERAEVWSIGVTAFYLLTQRLPFEGKTDKDLVDSIKNETPAEQWQWYFDERIPEDHVNRDHLLHVFTKCFQKDPDQRYQTANEFARELSEALGVNNNKARRLREAV